MNAKILEFLKNEDAQSVRLLKDKLGKNIILIDNPSFIKEYEWKHITVVDGNTLQEIGKVQYSCLNSSNDRHVWLHNIKVNDKFGLNRAIGSYAIKFLEEITYSMFINTIEGKYYPVAPATGEQVKKFYARNGYLDKNGEPYRDGYELNIYKYLMKEDILLIAGNTTKNEEGYKVYGDIKNMYFNATNKDCLEA